MVKKLENGTAQYRRSRVPALSRDRMANGSVIGSISHQPGSNPGPVSKSFSRPVRQDGLSRLILSQEIIGSSPIRVAGASARWLGNWIFAPVTRVQFSPPLPKFWPQSFVGEAHDS